MGRKKGAEGGTNMCRSPRLETMEQKQEAGSLFLETGRSVSRSLEEPEKKRMVFCPNPHAASYFETSGRLKLTVLSEDRLQIKWKEADGPVQGYKVRVRPISGKARAQTPVALPSTWWFHRFTENTPASCGVTE